MVGTQNVVRAVAAANPETVVTEDRVRRVLRRGLIPTVRLIAGRLVWSRCDVETLVQIMNLRMPADDMLLRDQVRAGAGVPARLVPSAELVD